MNAHSKIEAIAPAWALSPAKMDWSVMIYGGTNPRTGFEQPPLEFQFYGLRYSRRQIEHRAADLAEREHRTSWQIMPPTNPNFIKGEARLADGELMAIRNDHKRFDRLNRRAVR